MNDDAHSFHELSFDELPPAEMQHQAEAFREGLSRRRSVRHFSDRPVDRHLIETCIAAAGTAPSGANLQPWHFAVVESPEMKRQIRRAAELEERAFYDGRAPQEWLDAVAPLGTDAEKPFLETAPYLIAIFAEAHGLSEEGAATKNYYVSESVGIATGFLIAALHQCGLATLTHTPSPMRFLNEVLDRPKNERAYLLLVVGYPAEDAIVPTITKKPLSEICTFY